MTPKPLVGLLLSLASAVCYASMNITVKVSTAWLSAWQSGAGRFLFGLLALPLLVKAVHSSLKLTNHRWLMVRSVFGAAAFILMVMAYQTAPLSQAITLFYIYPALCALLAPLLVGDKIPGRDWPFIGGTFAGVVLIVSPLESAIVLTPGHFLALAAGLCAAITLTTTRRCIQTNSSWAIYFHVCLIGLIGCLAPMALDSRPLCPPVWQGWLGLAGTGLFALLAQVTMNGALGHLQAHHVGVILSLEVVLVAGFGVIGLGETAGPTLVIGGLLILGCGVLLNFKPAAK